MLLHEERKYQSGMPIHSAIFKNKNFLAHWHSDIELVLVCKGSLGMGINSDYKILKEGDIAVCNSGDIHYYDSHNMESTIILIIFRPELIGNVINLLINTKFAYPFIDSYIIDKIEISSSIINNIKTCIKNIYKEINQQDNHFQLLVKSHLMELIGLLLRHIPHYSNNCNTNLAEKGCLKLIQKAINFIENNYMLNITLEDVSTHLNIHPSYFSKFFSKATGITFKAYLNSLRIEKADNLLKSTDDPIIDIAYECGFNSIRTFNRVFKNLRGITPSDLR